MTMEFYPGMGRAVAERTILRKNANGEWESWSDVARRVALGNSLLCADKDEQQSEYEKLRYHIDNGNILMSGRHLQHGDETQPTRNQEVFSNCSTSCTSFSMFYLLLNGSGVGRAYDDDMMLVNWDHAPNIHCVLDHTHPDYDYSAHESVRDALHKYGPGSDGVVWHKVGDSREGWAKALEIYENMAFEKIHRDATLILDFSGVRCKGSPIKGMQDRPASGPVPLINSFHKAATVKGAGMPKWKQSLYIDHYFAECVLFGGARRSARMSTKYWRDPGVIEFVEVKRPIEYQGKTADQIRDYKKNQGTPSSFLWSSNNSVTVDQEFWNYVKQDKVKGDVAIHAKIVFNAVSESAYNDGTGEPGFINVDRFTNNKNGMENVRKFGESNKYKVDGESHLYLTKLLKRAKGKKYAQITNPCVTADSWVMTSEGAKQVSELIGTAFDAVVNGQEYCASGFWSTGVKEVFQLKTNRGYSLKATADHKILVQENKKNVWKEMRDLREGDCVVLNNHDGYLWDGEGTYEEGWIVGQVLGNGGHNPDKYASYMRFWNEEQEELSDYAVSCIRKCGLKTRSDFVGKNYNVVNKTTTTACSGLTDLVSKYLVGDTKEAMPLLERTSSDFYRGFLCGFFDADGTVLLQHNGTRSVRASQNNKDCLYMTQRMLSRLGIASTVYENRNSAGIKQMIDGKGGKKGYECLAVHEISFSGQNIFKFSELIGFRHPAKSKKLSQAIDSYKKGPYGENFVAKVMSVDFVGEEEVFDCSVEGANAFDCNGVIIRNCGEIELFLWGSFCVIADLVPYHSSTLDEAEDAFRATTRALIRVNMMDSIYADEVKRTNRIGVGITGIHEFAWKFFGYGFYDLIDEQKSKDFWLCLSRFKRAVRDEAVKYSHQLGVAAPMTDTTIKPAGSTSKLAGLTEGWHLPAMEAYLRWVQYNVDSPLVQEYRDAGYPTLELKTYRNTVVVGFPTQPLITTLGMGDKLVTATQATPEEQYQWLMLGEKYWIRGVDEHGEPLPEDTGNQISYTLKYDPAKVSYEQFRETMKAYQSRVKCCSVMPTEDTSSYEYLPEQPITKAEYEAIVSKIKEAKSEDVDKVHVDCAGGACPVDFKK